MNFRGWSTKVLDATWPVSEGAAGMQAALARICDEATAAIDAGYEFIVISDRNQGAHGSSGNPAHFVKHLPSHFINISAASALCQNQELKSTL